MDIYGEIYEDVYVQSMCLFIRLDW
jgi:hypothetical protein